MALDGQDNVIVTGYSAGLAGNFITIKYSSADVPLWTNRYNGPANGDDCASHSWLPLESCLIVV